MDSVFIPESKLKSLANVCEAEGEDIDILDVALSRPFTEDDMVNTRKNQGVDGRCDVQAVTTDNSHENVSATGLEMELEVPTFSDSEKVPLGEGVGCDSAEKIDNGSHLLPLNMTSTSSSAEGDHGITTLTPFSAPSHTLVPQNEDFPVQMQPMTKSNFDVSKDKMQRQQRFCRLVDSNTNQIQSSLVVQNTTITDAKSEKEISLVQRHTSSVSIRNTLGKSGTPKKLNGLVANNFNMEGNGRSQSVHTEIQGSEIVEKVKLQPGISGYKVQLIGRKLKMVSPRLTATAISNNFDDDCEVICNVCGDKKPLGGNSYGTRACEGCKSFFKRIIQGEQSVPTKVSYCSNNDGECFIDKYSRTKCRYCRFKACLMAGMKAECVLRPKYEIDQRFISDTTDVNASAANVTQGGPQSDPTGKRSNNQISRSKKTHFSPGDMKRQKSTCYEEVKTRLIQEFKDIIVFEKDCIQYVSGVLDTFEKAQHQVLIESRKGDVWAVDKTVHISDLLAASQKNPVAHDAMNNMSEAKVEYSIQRLSQILLEQTILSFRTLPVFELLRAEVKAERISRTWSKLLILSAIEQDTNLAVEFGIKNALKQNHYSRQCESSENIAKRLAESARVLNSVIFPLQLSKLTKIEILILKLLVVFTIEGFHLYGLEAVADIMKMRRYLQEYLYEISSARRGLCIMDSLTQLMGVTDLNVIRVFYPAYTREKILEIVAANSQKMLM